MKSIEMWYYVWKNQDGAGDEKIITNGLKLDNLKVKNKEQKFRINLAMNNSILYCKFHTELCYKRPYWV